MPEPFDLRTWLRRHPLTVLLLAATVGVNAVAIFAINPRNNLVEATQYSLGFSQLSLLAWWTTGASWFAWGRIILVALTTYAFSEAYSFPGMTNHNFALFSVFAAITIVSSWIWRRLFGFQVPLRLRRVQFSIRQMLSLTTLCALLAMGLQYAHFGLFVSGEFRFWFVFTSLTVFGIIGPGVIFTGHWLPRARWIFPSLIGIALSFAVTKSVNDDQAEFWVFFCISGVVYSLWGLAIGIDAQRRSATIHAKSTDPPFTT